MVASSKKLGLVHRLTGDCRNAQLARDILIQLAKCYRNWLYHDYRDTFADCDPLYAAWHEQNLPLEWKRHLCTDAYRKDSVQKAGMLQTYWGAGRLWPSTDAITKLADITFAYDLTRGSCDANGKPLWDAQGKGQVERDLILEYLMTAEPFLGGPNKADNWSNKSPRVYYAMAVVGHSLQVPNFLKTSLNGYSNVLDRAFLPDGFSRQSPGYTGMYLTNLSGIPEVFDNCRALSDSEVIALKENNERLKMIYRAIFDQLRPDGSYFPLADTQVGRRPSRTIMEIAALRCPSFADSGSLHSDDKMLGEFAMASFALSLRNKSKQSYATQQPEIYFPSWMTAILRHQVNDKKSALTFTLSPYGGHRHRDNLALFYEDDGDIILGDHGYFGTSPVNRWMKSAFSHNLVIVDNQEQNFSDRRPSLHRMLTSPKVSVVEASSKVYEQCDEYRRLVLLFKGPDGATFVVDIFRVKGGNTHDYRVFSEIASSDDEKGSMEFFGLNIPAAGRLPKGGAGLTESEIFGLKGPILTKNPQKTWQAVWKGDSSSYRLWCVSQVDEVIFSSGPGQEKKSEIGRRVRYLDAIRRGKNLESTFVAVHEPLHNHDSGPIEAIEQVHLAENVGNQALALKIKTKWGTYYMLNHFDREADVQNVRFKGKLAVLGQTPDGKAWALASEAETLEYGSLGFSHQPANWSGQVNNYTVDCIKTLSKKPEKWANIPGGCQNYVLIFDGDYQTGYPVCAIEDTGIVLARFPLMKANYFVLPSFDYIVS